MKSGLRSDSTLPKGTRYKVDGLGMLLEDDAGVHIAKNTMNLLEENNIEVMK
jgi:hypothetical protein